VSPKTIKKALLLTLAYSKERNYKGFNKHDGLNSAIVYFFLGWSKWTRILAIQTVMRFPINIRRLVFTRTSDNPKGLSLFLRAYVNLYKLTYEKQYLAEANELLIQLDTLKVKSKSGVGWGYMYPWQDLGFYAKPGTPNAVVTCFVIQGLMELLETNGSDNEKIHTLIQDAINFLLNDLPVLKDHEDELCFGYMPMPMKMRVMDVSILIAAALYRYESLNTEKYYLEKERLLNYVIKQQTTYGAWYYTDPPCDSPINHDNYHTGFILDAIAQINSISSNQILIDSYDKGLKFYYNELFTLDGFPKFQSHLQFPYDIHGFAQGIITFSRHLEQFTLSNMLIKNALQLMFNEKGYFYYQKNRFYTKKFNLMRWCNAWMSFALSEYLLNVEK
jgi:hypothetical protein